MLCFLWPFCGVGPVSHRELKELHSNELQRHRSNSARFAEQQQQDFAATLKDVEQQSACCAHRVPQCAPVGARAPFVVAA